MMWGTVSVRGILQTFPQLTSVGIYMSNDLRILDVEIIILLLDAALSACLVLPQISVCIQQGQALRNEALSRCFAFPVS